MWNPRSAVDRSPFDSTMRRKSGSKIDFLILKYAVTAKEDRSALRNTVDLTYINLALYLELLMTKVLAKVVKFSPSNAVREWMAAISVPIDPVHAAMRHGLERSPGCG